MSLRTFLVDDEEKSRRVLRQLLENFCPEVEIIGEAGGIKETLEALPRLNPDLVFLDIRLKEGDSFDILEQLDSIPFDIVFVTAFDEVSVKALEYSGIPCLLKPIDIDELVSTVERIKSHPNQTAVALEKANGMLRSRFRQIPVETVDGLFFIDPTKILFIKDTEAHGAIQMENGDVLTTRKKGNEIYDLLDKERFFRTGEYIVQVGKLDISTTSKRKLKFEGGIELTAPKSEVLAILKKLQ